MTTENMRATTSQEELWMIQDQVFKIYDLVSGLPPHAQSVHFEIRRDNHMEYLTKSLKRLNSKFSVLDANRPWLCYWMMQSMAVLGDCVDDKLEHDVIDFLDHCQDKNGRYGGGPGQMLHLATTYAAVMTLITVGGNRSLSSINRKTLSSFLLSMKDKSGGFRMHDGGEIDVRACYTAIAVASVLNILDDKLIQNLGDYIVSCQSYEGGISGEPCSEAHGGMKEEGCGRFVTTNGRVAAIIQRLHLVVNEQLGIPNAFEEECSTDSEDDSTNSNVSEIEECSESTSAAVNEIKPDASLPMGMNNMGYNFIKEPISMRPIFHSMALQQYILLCTQEKAGFRDKPGKARDHYHTCYVLSGLSVSQHSSVKHANSPPLPMDVMGRILIY